MREFEPKYTPEINANNRVGNFTPEAERFFAEAIRYGGFSRLNFRTARIIDAYIGAEATYADLAKIAGVTRARIGQIIGKGVERLLLTLPDEVREQFQNGEPLIIKSSFSTETRAKMSEALKGQWEDPDYRAKMSEALKGQWEDPDYRAKMSEARKGQWEDPDYRAKMSEARKGRVVSTETRAKMSEARKGYWENKKALE